MKKAGTLRVTRGLFAKQAGYVEGTVDGAVYKMKSCNCGEWRKLTSVSNVYSYCTQGSGLLWLDVPVCTRLVLNQQPKKSFLP